MASLVERASAAPGPARTAWPAAWLTDLSLVLMALIWAVNYSVVKYGMRTLAPLAYNGIRVSLAAVVLAVLAAARGVSWPPRRRTAPLLALGVLGNGVYQLFFIFGLAHSRAGTAALMFGASPAFIALLARARGTEHVSARRWSGIALQLAGVAYVVLGSTTAGVGEDTPLGVALILAGTLCWATYTVLLKPYTACVDGVHVAAITMAGGAVPIALVALPAVRAAPWHAVPPSVWGALTYSGVMALVVAYLLWYRGVRVLGPTRTAMYGNLQPLLALVVAWLALGERPTPWQALGAACLMTGLLLSGR